MHLTSYEERIIIKCTRKVVYWMKKMLKNMLFAVVFCCCILSIVSCGGGIKGAEAKSYINEFFTAIVDEDYNKAETLIHPERPADLETFILNIEKEINVDFQDGIEIEKYTGFSSSVYDSTVGGSTYELTMKTVVGDRLVEFTIELVKNENGYGIYNLDVNT